MLSKPKPFSPIAELRDPLVIEVAGKKVFGVFHRPRTSQAVPAVLICHGLGGNKIGKHRAYVKLAEALASAGIAALRIDFRGLGDSEGDFSETTPKTKIEDALAALNYLSSHEGVDPNRIGIFGRSFGGSVAIKASCCFQKVKSIVVWAPLFDVAKWQGIWQKYLDGKLASDEFKAYTEIDGQTLSLSFLEQLFALGLDEAMPYLKNIPLLHIQGEKDRVIENSHALKFKNARLECPNHTKFLQLSESDHEFSVEHERLKAIEETIAWFCKTL